MQYFCRQIVYANSYCRQNNQDIEPQDVSKNFTDKDSPLLQKKSPVTLPDNLIQSFIIFVGGLHIQLNARQDLVGSYHKFVKFMYESIFEGSVLALKPRPWRTSNMLEIMYGGWTLIREDIMKKFARNKSVETANILTFVGYIHPFIHFNLLCYFQIK